MFIFFQCTLKPHHHFPLSLSLHAMSTLSLPDVDTLDEDDTIIQWDNKMSGADDDDELMSSHVSRPPPNTTCQPASDVPQPSSEISQPSGLPISKISSLTHDELWHNPEFMWYVKLMVSLQDLLNLRQKPTLPLDCESPSSFFFLCSIMFFEPQQQARHAHHCAQANRHPKFRLRSLSCLYVFLSRAPLTDLRSIQSWSSGLLRTASQTPL